MNKPSELDRIPGNTRSDLLVADFVALPAEFMIGKHCMVLTSLPQFSRHNRLLLWKKWLVVRN